ncbi:flagellar motor protein MotB [Euzebya sp.]|uniref:OmpA/MotB family protein n=1 Tax=Euzebya sp. TaxID=1971409 RepID=UPI003517AF3B
MAKHRCKEPDPPADTGRWLGTYGDMVTLLMAFFVMLFAVSDTNAKKFEAFVSGLAGPFDNPAVEMGLVNGTRLEDTSATPISLIAPQRNQSDPEDPLVDELGETDTGAAGEAAEQLNAVEEQLEEALSDLEIPISADIRDDERGLVISISTDDVLFATGSAVLNPDGHTVLGEIAPVLLDAPNTVVIEGHTDDQPMNRGGYTNWNLSTDRAIAVLQHLGEVHGFPYDRISAAGYGEHRPLVPNDSPENRATNRRVEILIVALDLSDSGVAPPPVGVEPPILDFSEPLPGTATPAGGSTSVATIIGG